MQPQMDSGLRLFAESTEIWSAIESISISDAPVLSSEQFYSLPLPHVLHAARHIGFVNVLGNLRDEVVVLPDSIAKILIKNEDGGTVTEMFVYCAGSSSRPNLLGGRDYDLIASFLPSNVTASADQIQKGFFVPRQIASDVAGTCERLDISKEVLISGSTAWMQESSGLVVLGTERAISALTTIWSNLLMATAKREFASIWEDAARTCNPPYGIEYVRRLVGGIENLCSGQNNNFLGDLCALGYLSENLGASQDSRESVEAYLERFSSWSRCQTTAQEFESRRQLLLDDIKRRYFSNPKS